MTTTLAPERPQLEEWPVAPPTWAQRIDEAEARGYFTKVDGFDATRYNTCAVGERYGFGGLTPEEAAQRLLQAFSCKEDSPCPRVYELGTAFPMAVLNQRFTQARAVLAEIAALPDLPAAA